MLTTLLMPYLTVWVTASTLLTKSFLDKILSSEEKDKLNITPTDYKFPLTINSKIGFDLMIDGIRENSLDKIQEAILTLKHKYLDYSELINDIIYYIHSAKKEDELQYLVTKIKEISHYIKFLTSSDSTSDIIESYLSKFGTNLNKHEQKIQSIYADLLKENDNIDINYQKINGEICNIYDELIKYYLSLKFIESETLYDERIVSEMTHVISLNKTGNLYRNFTLTQIEKEIKDIIKEHIKKKSH